jgi:hypothetical protein
MSLLQKAVPFNAKAQSREVAMFLWHSQAKICKKGLIFVKKWQIFQKNFAAWCPGGFALRF